MVRLSLRCDFPQAFDIACVLPFYTFALILSDPARAALGRRKRLCQYSCPNPHGVGGISEALLGAHNSKSLITCHRAASPYYAILLLFILQCHGHGLRYILVSLLNYIMQNSDIKLSLNLNKSP